MPSKSDDDATRIRNNQRRSRARRKDVLKHFQARVQHYETVGITATQEMQRAARKVASENKRLRMLLGCYGVTDAEINCYLQNFERCQRPHPLNDNDLVHTAMGRQPTLPVTAVAELVSLFPGIVVPSFMDANPEIETPQTWYDWTAASNVSQSSSLTWSPTRCTTALQIPFFETEEIFGRANSRPTALEPQTSDHPQVLAGSNLTDAVQWLE